MWKRDTPEVAQAKRAYQARGKLIQSGAMPGLLERESKVIRPEIRALIDKAVADRLVEEPDATSFHHDPRPKEAAENNQAPQGQRFRMQD
jgi:Ribonuclease G/E